MFQSFVTGTTAPPKRGVANATYLLSYDIGIGIGSLLMGCLQESIGLSTGFGLTAIAYFCEKNINAAPIVNATLQDACKLLSETGVKKIPVVRGDKVVGIVSRSAITHYLQKRYLAHAAQTALS